MNFCAQVSFWTYVFISPEKLVVQWLGHGVDKRFSTGDDVGNVWGHFFLITGELLLAFSW